MQRRIQKRTQCDDARIRSVTIPAASRHLARFGDDAGVGLVYVACYIGDETGIWTQWMGKWILE